MQVLFRKAGNLPAFFFGRVSESLACGTRLGDGLVLAGAFPSIDFGSRCREAGVRPSMRSLSDCHDNAM
ncbi:MAG TPA: hypothetical protein VHL58_19285 [Thermoanaerobaculia bacterium]|nr:hypothetical protein [Thermoanaerobaculia bacterium]